MNLFKYMEDKIKHEKFVKLASKRTNDILERLRILSNCSNRGAYDYSEEEINKIFSVIEKQLKEAKGKFTFPKKEKFKF